MKTIDSIILDCKKTETEIIDNGEIRVELKTVGKSMLLELLFEKFTFDEIIEEMDEESILEHIGIDKMRDQVLQYVEDAKVGL